MKQDILLLLVGQARSTCMTRYCASLSRWRRGLLRVLTAVTVRAQADVVQRRVSKAHGASIGLPLAAGQHGFTLIEMLVVMGVMVVAFGFASLCLEMGFGAFRADAERLRMQEFGQTTVGRMASDLGKAEIVTVDCDGRRLSAFSVDVGRVYEYEAGARRLKRVSVWASGAERSSVLSGSDVDVRSCTFSDHGDYVRIGITLQTGRNARNGRPEYRISTDVATPNRQR